MASPVLKFAFLDNPAYDGRDFKTKSVSGTEAGTMLLAEALSRRGHEVSIYNDRSTFVEVNGVRYRPLADMAGAASETIAISNNSIAMLVEIAVRRRVVWGRLDLRLGRLRKKRELLPVLRVRPHLVVPSRYSARRTQIIIPFRSRQIIEHGVDPAFLVSKPLSAWPAPIVVFASQPRRNLDLVLQAWRERVRPKFPAARLHVYAPRQIQLPGIVALSGEDGIEIKGSVTKHKLAEAFRNARAMIYPGHKEETFCNVAAEAIAVGLPVVTMGIGALAERVRHGVDGFVVPTVERMGDHVLRLLEDEALWRRLHRAGIEASRARSWDVRAAEWEKAAAGWR